MKGRISPIFHKAFNTGQLDADIIGKTILRWETLRAKENAVGVGKPELTGMR